MRTSKGMNQNSLDRFNYEFNTSLLEGSERIEPLSKQTFKIKEINKFGFFINYMKIRIIMASHILRWIITGEVRKNFISYLGSEEFNSLENKLNPIMKKISDILNAKKSITTLAAALFFIVITPFILMLFLIFVIKKSLERVNLVNPQGFFCPMINDGKIYIKKDLRDNDIIEAIISHEHLHFVQYHYNAIMKGKIKRPRLEKITTLLDENHGVSLDFIRYHFSPDEIEARLHELMICHFRKFSVLPCNIAEFMDFLRSFKFYNLLVNPKAHLDDRFKDLILSRYPDTVEKYFLDIHSIIKKDCRCIFYEEILPNLYLNLLDYYGSDRIKVKFKDSLPSNTNFKQIYEEVNL